MWVGLKGRSWRTRPSCRCVVVLPLAVGSDSVSVAAITRSHAHSLSWLYARAHPGTVRCVRHSHRNNVAPSSRGRERENKSLVGPDQLCRATRSQGGSGRSREPWVRLHLRFVSWPHRKTQHSTRNTRRHRTMRRNTTFHVLESNGCAKA